MNHNPYALSRVPPSPQISVVSPPAVSHSLPQDLAGLVVENLRRSRNRKQKAQVKASTPPPQWEYLWDGKPTGLTVRAWTVGEARAACKKAFEIPKVGRLPVGATVRLVGEQAMERVA